MKHGYLFPEVALRNGSHTDPRELNVLTLPVAERYMGEVGPHNLKEDIGDDLLVAANAMTAFHLADMPGDPGLAAATAPSAAATAFPVPESYEWARIVDPSGTYDDMVLTVTATGRGVYKIYGFAQYGFDIFGASATLQTSAKVQIGLFIDGALIPGASTGKTETNDRDFWPIRVIEPKTQTAPVPARVVRSQRADAMGPAAKPVLISWIVELEAGSHSFELKARRTPGNDLRHPSSWRVYVHSARLLVLQHPQTGGATVGAAVVTVTPIETEDIVQRSTWSTTFATLQQVQNGSASTGLVEGSLRRGAMSSRHLPSPLLAVAQGTFVPPGGPVALQNRYPGFSSNTVNASSASGVTAWWEITDGAGQTFRCDNGGAGFGASAAEDASFLVILADISVQSVERRTAITSVNSIFGCFKLGYYSGAAWVTLSGTLGFVNSFNRYIIGGTDRVETSEETSVSLLGILDLRSAQLAADIDYFSVLGSEVSTVAAGDATIRIRRGAIQVFQYRP